MTIHSDESPSALRVGLVQFKPRKGDVEGNLARVRQQLAEAGTEHDLLVFPESCLTGYFMEGGVSEGALAVEELAEGLGPAQDDGVHVVLGFYERWRRGIHNSVAYLEPHDGSYRAVHVHRKIFLPTYGIFEEARFVDPGRELVAFDTTFGRMGILVCEEMWHSLPPTILALDGAELIIVVSASPAREFLKGQGRPGNLQLLHEASHPGCMVPHGLSELDGTVVDFLMNKWRNTS